jgi:hypothetical protein
MRCTRTCRIHSQSKKSTHDISNRRRREHIPNPGTHDKTIVCPNFDHRVVDDDGEVKRLDLGVAGRGFADIEEAEFAGLAALRYARSQGFGGAGVGAVDDEGFVGEFYKNCQWLMCMYSGHGALTVVDARGLVFRGKDLEASLDAAVVASGTVEVDARFQDKEFRVRRDVKVLTRLDLG